MEMKTDGQKINILVVDDSPQTLEMLERTLRNKGYSVHTASSTSEGIRLLKKEDFDLVLTDYKMPEISGMELIKHIDSNYKDIEVVMITGYSTVNGAVKAVKAGAEEYLPKPFTEEELFEVIDSALDKLERRRAASEQPSEEEFSDIIGESQPMKELYKSIKKAANTKATVLIEGESGTGKELVARAIHYNSERASSPFVPINCGGIPEDLLESELFGHVKGAFTGAEESRAGFFQTAEGGSLFLDEVSETSTSMQVKLLRVLQDKEVTMVGSRRPQKVDVRIIAATNKNLTGLIKKGAFREDLYYRLNVINITVPPLRERGDDILLLVKHFTKKFSEEIGKAEPEFSDKVLKLLQEYNWPGNVRELENLVQRLIVMNEGPKITAPDLPSLLRYNADYDTGLNRSLKEVEAEHIMNVYENVDENKTKAAEILGISRKTLRKKIKKIRNNNYTD